MSVGRIVRLEYEICKRPWESLDLEVFLVFKLTREAGACSSRCRTTILEPRLSDTRWALYRKLPDLVILGMGPSKAYKARLD